MKKSKALSIQNEVTTASKAEWNKFLETIGQTRRDLGCEQNSVHEAWFRGHSKSSYELLPSLFRYLDNHTVDDIWQKEKDLFWEFSARARELHGVIESDWDILFAMQHYTTPTRLLDWTEVLAVAVYFAVLNVDATETSTDKADPPCVWVLNPYRLNEYSAWKDDDLIYPPNLGWDVDEETFYSYGDLLVEEGIGWNWPVAIYPRQRTARVHAQCGWFTMHGDKFKPMEKRRGRGKNICDRWNCRFWQFQRPVSFGPLRASIIIHYFPTCKT